MSTQPQISPAVSHVTTHSNNSDITSASSESGTAMREAGVSILPLLLKLNAVKLT